MVQSGMVNTLHIGGKQCVNCSKSAAVSEACCLAVRHQANIRMLTYFYQHLIFQIMTDLVINTSKSGTNSQKTHTLYNQGWIFIFLQEGWKKFRWGASHMQYAILDALGGT